MPGGRRPNRIPAALLVSCALFLVLRPLACRGAPPLVAVPDSGPLLDLDSGPDGGPDAGDGGYHSDSGCEIRGEIIPGGYWLNVQNGSCTYCDPALNPNGWTVLDSGQPCRGFAREDYLSMSYPTVPFEGVCGWDNHPFGTCGGSLAGFGCNPSQGLGCQGGQCNADGWCEVTQNLGWFTACAVEGAIPPNACASGPCCPDGGYFGVFPDGGGWCCGLTDGGVPGCLAAGEVCVLDSNCCTGLHCQPPSGVLPGGAGSYGTCE
jgi:hypothetical protein